MPAAKVPREKILLRLTVGTLDRIDATRDTDETRTDFIRQAVQTELKKRERSKAR